MTYIQFDDSKVTDFVFSWFGSSNDEYISQHRIAYPKPGTENPKVKVNVIDLDDLDDLKVAHVVPPPDMANM